MHTCEGRRSWPSHLLPRPQTLQYVLLPLQLLLAGSGLDRPIRYHLSRHPLSFHFTKRVFRRHPVQPRHDLLASVVVGPISNVPRNPAHALTKAAPVVAHKRRNESFVFHKRSEGDLQQLFRVGLQAVKWNKDMKASV